MPLIHHSDGNFYQPSESLQRMFDEVILCPLRRELRDLWHHRRNLDVLERVRVNVLDRGCTDFNQPYEGPSPLDGAPVCYSPAQKVLLYCAVYMPMHLYSSYHVYRTFLPRPRVKVLFVDVGCGPLTSGIAYRSFAKHADISYIGIDRADEMINIAEEIDRRGPGGQTLFNWSALIFDYSALPDFVESHVSGAEAILINCCYCLASYSLNADDLADALVRIMSQYPKHPMRVVYQNPKGFLDNWNRLKFRLMRHGFRSTGLNPQQFSYPRLTGGIHRDAPVECETLYKPLI